MEGGKEGRKKYKEGLVYGEKEILRYGSVTLIFDPLRAFSAFLPNVHSSFSVSVKKALRR